MSTRVERLERALYACIEELETITDDVEFDDVQELIDVQNRIDEYRGVLLDKGRVYN